MSVHNSVHNTPLNSVHNTLHNSDDEDVNDPAIILIRSKTSTSSSRPSNDNRPIKNGNRRTARGSTLVCENYGFNSHTIDRCFKIIGYPADFRKKKAGSNFKGKNVSNNTVGSSSSNGFSNEQMATLISLIKENSVNRKGVHSNMAGVTMGGIPLNMWSECVLTATYLINRLPTYVLNGKSPYDLVSEKCVPVGYLNFKKGYKLWSLDNKQIVYSRDVKFKSFEFFQNYTLDDFPDMPNDEDRRNPNPTRHGNSPSHLGSHSASLSKNDAAHSQDVDVSASENGCFPAYEENNNNSEVSGLHDQTQEDVSQVNNCHTPPRRKREA
ncbi:hypothetical protein Tco_1129387 [Tanacetum coccineum]